MTSLPIPFVVAFLLVLMALSYRSQLKETASGQLFAIVIYVNAVSMILIGLRWSQDLVVVLPAVATLAVVGSALLYLAFRSLGRRGPAVSPARDWVHLLPIIVVALSSLFFFRWVDVFLIGFKLLYGCLLIMLARKMPDSLQLVRLSWLKNTQKALWGAVFLLLLSCVLDLIITIDFALYDGRHAARLVGYVSLGTLLLLGWASVQAGKGRTQDTVAEPLAEGPDSTENDSVDAEPADRPVAPDEDSASLVEKLNRLLVEERLYADTELNLQRLARKAGVPARTISRAINTQTGQNISQWVNQTRIEAVCQLLKDNEVAVSEAMMDSGFLTKSNFNREFRRIKGCSPSEWRKANQA